MSEGYQILITEDGTQLILDPTSGKYYTSLSNYLPIRKVTHNHQSSNYVQVREVNLAALQSVD